MRTEHCMIAWLHSSGTDIAKVRTLCIGMKQICIGMNTILHCNGHTTWNAVTNHCSELQVQHCTVLPSVCTGWLKVHCSDKFHWRALQCTLFALDKWRCTVVTICIGVSKRYTIWKVLALEWNVPALDALQCILPSLRCTAVHCACNEVSMYFSDVAGRSPVTAH